MISGNIALFRLSIAILRLLSALSLATIFLLLRCQNESIMDAMITFSFCIIMPRTTEQIRQNPIVRQHNVTFEEKYTSINSFAHLADVVCQRQHAFCHFVGMNLSV